jgi:CNT family concentrative nucleoside transporter
VLRFDYGQQFMAWAGGVVQNMLAATYRRNEDSLWRAGTAECRSLWRCAGKNGHPNAGSIFAFQVLPTIIFISAFFAVLYHIGLMQIIIRGWRG